METWGLGRRILMGAVWGIGLGLLAGAMESVGLAASEKLSLGFFGFALLGATASALMGAMGFGLGLLTAPVPFLLHRARPSTATAAHLAAIGTLLCGWYLWQGAWQVYTEERAIGALAMAAMPLGFTGVVYFNSRFFLRRMEIGRPLSLPWLPTAIAGSLALVLLSAGFFAARDTGGPYALADDRNLVFITVGGWNAGTHTDALSDSVLFGNAITPTPDTRAAAATVLTGLHPLRHRVLDASAPLSWAYITVPELLESEGYATAAFVSDSAANADSGLEQGFRVFDDDFSPIISGLFRLSLLKPLASRLAPGRSGEATIDRFEGWLGSKSSYPFMVWIHLPAGADLAANIGRIDTALSAAGVEDETLVVATGTYGEGGSHGVIGHNGLYDDTVRVPLLLRVPGVEVQVAPIPQQVRLMDIAGTAMNWLGIDGYETEGVDLIRYIRGTAKATVWCSLVGRTPDGSGVRVGLRNNGIKYLRDRDSGEEWLFHVDTDPDETIDINTTQPETLEAARHMLAPEEVALDKILR